MTTTQKVLLGLATASQWIAIVAFFAVAIYLITSNVLLENLEKYTAVFNLASFTLTIYFTAIIVFYIAHAARNQNLERSGMRVNWIIGLAVFGLFVEPIYWYLHIWRDGVPIREARSGPLGLN